LGVPLGPLPFTGMLAVNNVLPFRAMSSLYFLSVCLSLSARCSLRAAWSQWSVETAVMTYTHRLPPCHSTSGKEQIPLDMVSYKVNMCCCSSTPDNVRMWSSTLGDDRPSGLSIFPVSWY
jgi:hypothetical protein